MANSEALAQQALALSGVVGAVESARAFNSANGERTLTPSWLPAMASDGGLVYSLGMVIVSEIGDETFITAAILAMRNRRNEVLAGSLLALVLMTVLSTALGMFAPSVLNRSAVSQLASGLYLIFGLRLLYLGLQGSQSQHEEVSEVEGKLDQDRSVEYQAHSSSRLSAAIAATKNFLSKLCTRAFAEAFLLTFGAELGDRSQVTTITLAGYKSPLAVTIGALAGHTLCTCLAVYGGKLLAQRISPRAIALSGGALFLAFAVGTFISVQRE